ncbi:hypothetical protein [Methylobacterium sp. ARG-1]|uniref:hypothetical protein n=1 Tax=Methylobacterium sp. ARG-1 TaxID=1692501 RepID=UPI000680AFCE|nr:hypothetical protein [Methylobacterium sp. ARG-1]KNY24657.1 hypothetical protein AKJ13_01550 [Methylobacterium sp. ARG-1]
MTESREPRTVPEPLLAPIDLVSEAGLADIAPSPSTKSLPIGEDEPEVGLSQKGSDEDAIIRRETEI